MQLLKNAQILTPEYNLQPGSVLIDGAYIKDVIYHEPTPNLPSELPEDTEVTDLQGAVLLPGFVNAHAHSAMTLLSSSADDLPLQEWLFDKVFPAEKQMTPEDVYWGTKLAVLEYLQNGITSAFDMYFHQDAAADAYKDMGFRSVLCGSLNDYGGKVSDFSIFRDKYGDDPDALVSYRTGIHAEYTTGLQTIREVSAYLNEHQLPFYTHCSETAREVQECFDRYGKSPVQLFAYEGLFNFGGAIFHGTHLSGADRALLQKYGVSVVSCPASNLKLASGVCDLQALKTSGVSIALGTDGPASNNALSMFREMYLASVLQKNAHQDTTLMRPCEVLEFATKGGADLMRINAGQIAPGKLADLVALDFNPDWGLDQEQSADLNPNALTGDALSNIVYSGGTQNVLMTFVGGVKLYDRGNFKYSDSEVQEIYKNCWKIAKRCI